MTRVSPAVSSAVLGILSTVPLPLPPLVLISRPNAEFVQFITAAQILIELWTGTNTTKPGLVLSAFLPGNSDWVHLFTLNLRVLTRWANGGRLGGARLGSAISVCICPAMLAAIPINSNKVSPKIYVPWVAVSPFVTAQPDIIISLSLQQFARS